MDLSNDEMTSGSADRLRHELEQAYDSLEKLASSADHHERQGNKSSCDQNDRLKAELAQLRTDYEMMQLENSSLAQLLSKEREKNEVLGKDFSELESISGRLQSEVLKVDQEKIRLSEMVKSSQEENEVLGKVMEKISQDYDDLKRRFDQQAKIMRPDQKDDKIRALRNTARALESENELLSKERASLEAEARKAHQALLGERAKVTTAEEKMVDQGNELEAKNGERSQLLERFSRLESEKINTLRQLSAVQGELDAAESRIADLTTAEEMLRSLNEQSATAERGYDRKVVDVQREMERRLEEINAVHSQEVDSVKSRYVTLFDEKAGELHALREEHSKSTKELRGAEARISDLEYREEELQGLLSKSRSGVMEAELRERGVEFESEMTALRTHAAAVEEEVEAARRQYSLLQESYRNSVSMLESRLLEITSLLSKHDLSHPNGKQLEGSVDISIEEVADTDPNISPAKESHLKENKESSQNSESSKTNQTLDPKRESGGSGRRKRNRKKKRSLART